jgi:hypothetical protein
MAVSAFSKAILAYRGAVWDCEDVYMRLAFT